MERLYPNLVYRKELSLNSIITDKDHSLKSLIKLGVEGHFPLFQKSWIKNVNIKHPQSMSTLQKNTVSKITKRLAKHSKLDRKKTILLTLPPDDRTLFIESFMGIVETIILEKKPKLH